VLHRSLMGIRALIGRSLAEVRLTQGVQNREQFLVSGFIEELEPAATLEANARGIRLTVMPVEDGVAIEADRQVLGAVVGNLLQNAFKFTRPRTTVTLRVGASAERVLIEIQDACGGLPGGNVNELFGHFEQRGVDRTGLGIGLAFSRWGVEANNGRIYARNLPDTGCVFTVNLPRLRVPAVALSGPDGVSGSHKGDRMPEMLLEEVAQAPRSAALACRRVDTADPGNAPRERDVLADNGGDVGCHRTSLAGRSMMVLLDECTDPWISPTIISTAGSSTRRCEAMLH
jgi:hypothetical protein